MRRLFFLAMALSLAAFGQTASSRGRIPDAPKTAVLSGQVVRTDTAEPIAKANVYLTRQSTDPQSSATARKTETDARGSFRFERIVPGRYIVTAHLPGYVGARGGDTSSAIFALDAADDESTVLRLAPSPTIVGHVLDEDGIPLREAQVKVIARSSKGLRVLRTALTDDRGEYRLYGFAPGKHLVCAAYQERRKTSMRYHPRCFPDSTDVDDAEPLRFLPGQETPLNFVLFPANTVTVQGVVSGIPVIEGKLAAGAHVKFEPQWQSIVEDTHQTTVQDVSGRFSLRGLLPGVYTVTATAVTPKETLAFRDTVEVKETDDGVVELPLAKALDKSLDVFAHVAYDRNEYFPLNSVQVEFQALHSPEHRDGSLPPPSRAQGTKPDFWVKDRAGNLVTQSAEFHATIASGYTYAPVLTKKPAGVFLKSVIILGRGELPTKKFNAQLDTAIELVLSTGGTTITGDVTDSDGKAVADAIVLAAPDVGDPGRSATDQHGHFELNGLAPGTYRVYAFDSLGTDDSADSTFLEPFSNLAQTVNADAKTGASTQLKLIHVIEDGD
jgi:5-hydroxyisourate hydrolase-like protein (transthyretin family)